MKKTVSLFLGIVMLLLCFYTCSHGQNNAQTKGIYSYNTTDTVFLQNTRSNLQTLYGNTGGIYFDKTRNKWRVWAGKCPTCSQDSAWVDLLNPSGGGSFDSTNFWRTKSDFSIPADRTVTSDHSLLFTGSGAGASFQTDYFNGSDDTRFQSDENEVSALSTDGTSSTSWSVNPTVSAIQSVKGTIFSRAQFFDDDGIQFDCDDVGTINGRIDIDGTPGSNSQITVESVGTTADKYAHIGTFSSATLSSIFLESRQASGITGTQFTMAHNNFVLESFNGDISIKTSAGGTADDVLISAVSDINLASASIVNTTGGLLYNSTGNLVTNTDFEVNEADRQIEIIDNSAPYLGGFEVISNSSDNLSNLFAGELRLAFDIIGVNETAYISAAGGIQINNTDWDINNGTDDISITTATDGTTINLTPGGAFNLAPSNTTGFGAASVIRAQGTTGNTKDGGNLQLFGGNASGGTNSNGGDVIITSGAKSGSGTQGDIVLDIGSAGGKLRMPGNCGTATLVAGTVTVSYSAVAAGSIIILTSQSDGGTPGFTRISGRSAGTSFTITSSSLTDTSTIGYCVIDP